MRPSSAAFSLLHKIACLMACADLATSPLNESTYRTMKMSSCSFCSRTAQSLWCRMARIDLLCCAMRSESSGSAAISGGSSSFAGDA